MTAVPATKKEFAWEAWGETDPGKRRSNNEDRICCDAARGIFIIADGMGGEAAGEVAAQHAVDFMKKRLRRETGTVARRLREAIAGANNEIFHLAQSHAEWRGMACVLTAAVIADGSLHIGHVGDTRLYKIRGGQISKITSDHSPVGKREDAGELTELEAMRHPRRNEVFRDLGTRSHKPDDEEFVEYIQVPFEPDAAVFLCSDGLSDMLTSSEMLAAVLQNAGRPRDCVRALIAKANAAGGNDNISVIVIEADGFSQAVSGKSADSRRSRAATPNGKSERDKTPRALGGRWAFLVYGLLAGTLSFGLWQHYQTPGPDDNSPQTISPPLAKTLIVEPTSPEYPSLTRALEGARPGDRIEVSNGEYQESIRLKNGVDIVVRSAGKAVLHIVRPLPGVDAAVVADGVSGVNVRGLVIKAESSAGLPFAVRISNSDVSLSDCDISGAVQAGVLINGTSKPVLAGSYVHSNLGPGIVVSGTAVPRLTGNVIYANGLSRERAAPGMYIIENANPEVSRNVFSGNGAEAIRLQKQELRDKMMDNLFLIPGRPDKAVAVERTK
jgi:serine/threonine protein phosphatase PrpC